MEIKIFIRLCPPIPSLKALFFGCIADSTIVSLQSNFCQHCLVGHLLYGGFSFPSISDLQCNFNKISITAVRLNDHYQYAQRGENFFHTILI